MDNEIYIDDSLVFRRDSLNRSVHTTEHLPGFTCIRGWEGEFDDHETLLVSNNPVPVQLESGSANVWLVIRVTDYHRVGSLDDPRWEVSLRAVQPLSVGEYQLRMALDSKGFLLDEFLDLPERDKHFLLVEALVDAGFSAPLSTFYSDDAGAAVTCAKQESVLAMSAPNSYLSRQVNALGNTGWDFIEGRV